MAKPVLYVFSTSHYCEKARWALDYLAIDYQVKYLAPGLHMLIAKRLGARRSSLPILKAGGQLIQGSSDIIHWAEATASDNSKCLTPDNQRQQCLDIEKRLDDISGVHIRRYYYSEALVDHPQTIQAIFSKSLSGIQKLLLAGTWGKIRKLMIKGMDLGPDQRQESKDIIDGELQWLDELLSDGRRFLAGGQFSRADITAASLFAPLVLPEKHPTYADLKLPPGVIEDVSDWERRPVLNWIRELYAEYR